MKDSEINDANDLLAWEVPFSEYAESFENIYLKRKDGIYEITLHTNGDSFIWSTDSSAELGRLFECLSRDRGVKVGIITGTGESFCVTIADSEVGKRFMDLRRSQPWLYLNGEQMHSWSFWGGAGPNGPPLIAAINGPASMHSEIGLISDIVLASPDAYFQDKHLAMGLVPGDGIQELWEYYMGPRLARYYLLTGLPISALEAKQFGLVTDVLERDALLPRAWELAEQLASLSVKTLRYTRMALNMGYVDITHKRHQTGRALEWLGYEP